MKVSIFTDASVDNARNIGGFAFYIGCVAGKIQKAGKLKNVGKIPDSLVAELYAIGNALHTLKHSKFTPITNVIIYSDSLISVQLLNGDRNGLKDKDKRDIVDEIYFLMMEICLREGKSIRYVDTMFSFKHIKAHSGKKDKMSLINQWCDKNARKYMKTKETIK